MNAPQPYTEQCLSFAGGSGQPLAGIAAVPAAPSCVGLVIIVGGPQYRVGSHRQFTLLARHLAEAGHAVLRFDYTGMGDSTGPARPFDQVSGDVAAAMAALRQAVPQVQRVALWGLCDGASAALLYLDAQPASGVAGLCLLNPWVRSAQTQATTQVKHYYTQRLKDKAFWRKLLRGQVGLGRLAELAGSVRTMLAGQAGAQTRPGASLSFQHRMARAWRQARCPLLLVMSGRDLTAKEFSEAVAADPAWQGALAHPQLTRLDLPEADHTFSDGAAKAAVAQGTAEWLQQLAAQASAATAETDNTPTIGAHATAPHGR